MTETVFYAFPLDRFNRNASTEDIISDYNERTGVELPVLRLTPDELAEMINDERFNDQEYWLRAVQENRTSKDQMAESLRKEIIEEIVSLLKKEGLQGLTFSTCMEEYAYAIWFDRHDFPNWSRITGLKIVESGLMLRCGNENISLYTDSDYGARDISTLCDVLYVVKETIQQTPILKVCSIMGQYLKSNGFDSVEFFDDPVIYIDGLRKVVKNLCWNQKGTIITIETEDEVVALNILPDEKSSEAFLENMLRETGIEDLLESAFYKVNGVSNESFEYFINRQLAQL